MLDEAVRAALERLEAEDERDELEARSERSLAVLPTTGALLHTLALRRPRSALLEIGGSRGYSSIWIGAAARAVGGRLVSLEADEKKLARSRANIAAAGLLDWVEVVEGDAFETLPRLSGPFDFVFLDAWKDDYEALFELVRPKLSPRALVVADNISSHAAVLGAYSAARQADPGLLSLTLPLDSGLELTTVLTGTLHSG
jgi:predicted O-methyltransferase YrrM